MFKSQVRMITDGEEVKADVANRAPSLLHRNILYLKQLIEEAEIGQTIMLRARTVEAGLKVGQPVYFNVATDQFERAQASLAQDPETGYFVLSTTSQVWGIVHSKANATLADILLHGAAELDMSLAIDGEVTPGLYFLSSASAGKLISQRPSAGVTVLQVAGEADNGKRLVYVNTKFHDLLESHRHYRFELTTAPAGEHTQPAVGERHVIVDADLTLPGWLPADHSAFDGKAPVGAKFGYNIPMSDLAGIWPPQPPSGAYLEWCRGTNYQQLGQGVPLGASHLCVIDDHGIWWMSDCYDDVPWPIDYTNAESLSDSLSASTSEVVGECPRLLLPQLILWFTKPVFTNTSTWVSSLTAAANSGLIITCVDTDDAASAGHLTIDFNLGLVVSQNDAAGHLVLKSITEEGNLLRGPVLESIKSGNGNLVLSSGVALANGYRAGNVLLSVTNDIDGREVAVDTVRLEGVEEEYVSETLALGFTAARTARYRGRITIPSALELPTGTKLKLRWWVLNRSATNMPAEIFNFSYRKISQPSALATPLALPLSGAESAVASYPATAVGVTAANQYFLLETAAFDITAGDIVHFTLERLADDGFNGDLYVLRQNGVYVEPA